MRPTTPSTTMPDAPQTTSSPTSARLGTQFHEDDSVTFRVWAPHCSQLAIRLLEGDSHRSLPMATEGDGVYSLRTSAPDGSRYWIELPNGGLRPDPASRFQPEGVHGPSQLVNTRAFKWRDQAWRGTPKSSIILYELHLGTFTEGGTYTTAIDRLDSLVELGITAIELMPIVETAGSRNWGYDGVNLYAPRNSYGSPEQLKEFIDAAHERGIAVILDVVYNHFGPEGNYLHEFGGYVSTNHHSAWGDGPNYDGIGAATMRDFIVSNALYWIEEYHFDGLRLDAIHCMLDDSEVHIVTEIGQAIDALRRRLGRELCLIAESNVYDPEILAQLSERGHGFDAAWCDDFVHSVFAVLKPGEHMSRREYHPHSDLDIVLRRGFVFQGTLRTTRQRIPLERQTPAARLDSLVFAIQNHDFIGNHPHGLRLHQLVGHDAHRAAAALLLMHASIPMLYMGEEFASNSPFYFFADFGDANLRTAVEEGRRKEYPQHDWTNSDSPLSDNAFRHSRIGDAASGDPRTLDWYRELIRLRKHWRQIGLLSALNLEAEWDESARLARLTYRYQEEIGAVFIRLHSPGEEPRPLILTIEHPLKLCANCDGPDRHGKLQLNAFGVAILGTSKELG